MAKKKTSKRASSLVAAARPKTSAIGLFNMLSLKSVRVVESHSKLNIVSGTTPSNAEVRVGAQLAASVDNGTVLGNITATVATVVPEGKTASDVSTLSVEVVFQCVFDSSDPLPEQQDVTVTPEESSAINATLTYIAWPYIRAHVQMMTASMGVPPITLGLFKIQELTQPRP